MLIIISTLTRRLTAYGARNKSLISLIPVISKCESAKILLLYFYDSEEVWIKLSFSNSVLVLQGCILNKMKVGYTEFGIRVDYIENIKGIFLHPFLSPAHIVILPNSLEYKRKKKLKPELLTRQISRSIPLHERVQNQIKRFHFQLELLLIRDKKKGKTFSFAVSLK